MSNISRTTVINFSIGVYNGDDFQWNSKDRRMYAITFRCNEEITYEVLVERICRKIGVDQSITNLKLSYLPVLVNDGLPIDIFDDDDVYGYISVVDKRFCRNALHVEVVENICVGENSSFGVNYGVNGSAVIVEASDEGGKKVDGELKDDVEFSVNECVDTGVDTGVQNHSEVGTGVQNHSEVGTGVLNHSEVGIEHRFDDGVDPADDGVDATVERGGIVEYVEVSHPVEGSQMSIEAWEDGTGLELHQEFESKDIVIDLVRRASHDKCFGIKIKNSDTKRWVAKCGAVGEGCRWYVRVIKGVKSNGFKVTRYNKMHTCSRVSSSYRSTSGTQRLVASILKEDYPGQFETPTPTVLMGLVQTKVGVSVSYSTAWRGKFRAFNEVRGNPEESFRLLPSYLYMLEEANPGTKSRLELDDKERFKYLFIALGACIEGFKGMRKVIIVDATFLKAGYNGALVFASAQDPNHHHFPIAFGVIDGEKNASWLWFFETLKTIIPDSNELVFVTDRNVSLMNAIVEVYPRSHHGYCIYHMSQNVKSNVYHVNKDECAEKFMECARMYTEVEFLQKYNEFKAKYPTAVAYLEKGLTTHEEIVNSQKKWARCYFPGERYNIDTSNTVESMNSVFRVTRKYSLLPMIDGIIAKFSEWFNRNRKEAASGSDREKLVPYVENILHKSCVVASKLAVAELNSYRLEYKVTGKDGVDYVVDLVNKTCDCRHFDIDKYPCVHALAATMKLLKQKDRYKEVHYHDLCSKYYRLDLWNMAYEKTIYPVPHMSRWIIPASIEVKVCKPVYFPKRKGKKKQKRITSTGEHRSGNKRNRGQNLGSWFNCSNSNDNV